MTPLKVVTNPVDELPKVPKVVPDAHLLELCEPLIEYKGNDIRDHVKTTVKNHNIYYLCASKMKSAVIFLKTVY